MIKVSKTYFTLGIMISVLGANPSYADESIEEFLGEFHNNPAKMMQRLPSQVDDDGSVRPRGYIREKEADWQMFIEFRGELRDELIEAALETPSEDSDNDELGPSQGPDHPERIVEPGALVRSINEMHAKGLTQVTLPVAPWTDSYWPIYKGVVANRYADSSFPDSRDWITNFSYVNHNPASRLIGAGRVDALSPAEKYDYVMGDMSFGLTDYAWRQGQKYHNKYGRVPKWVGICHGWSAAAHMNMPIPTSSVTVRAVNGASVKFHPQDIKALQSMLWGKGPPRARIAGSRCNVSRPRRNRNGRIIDPKCFDVSPSTWHVAAVNQMGIHKRSFVMDNTYDHEVWNFPLLSFKYRYFNPQTWKESANVTAATVPIEKFTVDKFSEFRSRDARYVVGIFMDVTYVVESRPSRKASPASKPPTKTVRYIYDLELNARNEVIGGEWYSNAHPDFIWTFNSDAMARSREDSRISNDNWSLGEPIPSSWTDAARKASVRGVPLSTFVQRIANRGQIEPEPEEPEEPLPLP